MVRKKEESKLTHKVIEYSNYLSRARKLFGNDNATNNALALLYSENEVVAKIDIKGVAKFVVKI